MSRKMKDSGIEWIGEIPESWKIKPNKWVMKKKKEICEKYCGENILSLTMNGVVVRDLENPTGKMPLTFDGYQYVSAGNLLMCLFDIDVTPRCIGVINSDGLTSPAYSQFELIEGNERYYYYYYLNLDYTKELLHMAKNLRHSLTESQLGEIYVPVPSNEEQLCIANYLDTHCSLIDQTIEKQKQVIEKLKEYKQSVITEAVTKGLDPNVPMKDSGIEWIGEIPEHWGISKIKYFAKTGSGGTPSSSDRTNYGGNIKWVCSYDLKENEIFDTVEHLTEKGFENSAGSLRKEGTILLAMYGGSGTIGNSGILRVDASTNQAICGLTFDDRSFSDFMFYYIKAIRKYWMIYAVGTRKDPNISQTIVSNMALVVPKLSEQYKIAEYLDERTEKIEKAITIKERSISKLESYKKSLIYECVTGKREVK